MIRSVAASIILLLGLVLAAAPAAAAGSNDSAVSASMPTMAKYAWLWSDKGGVTPQRRYIAVAACTAECCCQMAVSGKTKNQCMSRDDCINAGGICRNKADEKCK